MLDTDSEMLGIARTALVMVAGAVCAIGVIAAILG